MTDAAGANVTESHLSSPSEVPILVHSQYDERMLSLPFDQVVPFGGEPRTVNIWSGGTDIGNCTQRFVTNGVLCTVEWFISIGTGFPSSTNPWEFQVPALIAVDYCINAFTWDNDVSHARSGFGYMQQATQRCVAYMHDTTSGNPRVRAGYPQAWATGDFLRICGTYMCRSIVST